MDYEEAVQIRKNNSKHKFAVETLGKNGVEVVEEEVGSTLHQYILDPRDTRKGAGIFLWGLIDFLVTHRDFEVLPEIDFKSKLAACEFKKEISQVSGV